MFSRLVGKETGYESRDSRLRQTFRILSALVPVLLPRRVGDGHAGLLKSGEHLGLREGRRLWREVDVRVRIKSGTATSSSPSSTATWSGHAKMWSGPIVEGDHLVVGVVGALLGEHLHLLHVRRSLPRQAGGALRGGTAEPVGRSGLQINSDYSVVIQCVGSQKVDPSFLHMFVTCTFQGTAVGSSLWLLPSQPERGGIVTIDRGEDWSRVFPPDKRTGHSPWSGAVPHLVCSGSQ